MASTYNNGKSASVAPPSWRCSNRLCTTVQTAEDRQDTGRKVVSDFFGRNKKETKLIDPEVWHVSCRMDYQRGAYAASKGSEKACCDFYLEHLRQQLLRIKLWRPQATFKVQLQQPAKTRLNEYHAAFRRNGGDVDAAKAAVAVTPVKGRKGENKPLSTSQAVKIEHAEYIDEYFTGEEKTLDNIIDTIVPWIERQVDNGSMDRLPPIEFLISHPSTTEPVIDPKTNYDRWVALTDGTSFASPTPASSSATSSPSPSLPAAAPPSPSPGAVPIPPLPPSSPVQPPAAPSSPTMPKLTLKLGPKPDEPVKRKLILKCTPRPPIILKLKKSSVSSDEGSKAGSQSSDTDASSVSSTSSTLYTGNKASIMAPKAIGTVTPSSVMLNKIENLISLPLGQQSSPTQTTPSAPCKKKCAPGPIDTQLANGKNLIGMTHPASVKGIFATGMTTPSPMKASKASELPLYKPPPPITTTSLPREQKVALPPVTTQLANDNKPAAERSAEMQAIAMALLNLNQETVIQKSPLRSGVDEDFDEDYDEDYDEGSDGDSDGDHDEGSDGEYEYVVVKGTPRYAGNFVYHAAKPKLVRRKRKMGPLKRKDRDDHDDENYHHDSTVVKVANEEPTPKKRKL